MDESDTTDELLARVRAASEGGTPLAPRGGGTKDFLGHRVEAQALLTSAHRGIVSYEPTELVVTVRSGTPLAELERTLAEHGQMLAFEPPHFGDAATVGGTIACGLSGPRRPYAGAARDFVLGVRVVNGRGQLLRFGGEVMKNVAGYDLSRLLTGSMGTLGLLLDVSMKVLPLPACTESRVFTHSPQQALRAFNAWAATPLPISAACHLDGLSYLRLSGTERGVGAAVTRLGGEPLPDAEVFWRELREHELAFFAGDEPALWRIALPSTAPPLALPGNCLTDWGGALRWVRTDADADAVRSVASANAGHATAFRAGADCPVFHPLDPRLRKLHQGIKAALDPHGIFNPGRMYPEL